MSHRPAVGCSASRVSFRTPPQVCLAAFWLAVLGCAPQPPGERLASSVACAAGAAALSHGAVTAEVPNSVTPLTSLLFDCLAVRALALAGSGGEPPGIPPRLDRLEAGPGQSVRAAKGAVRASGRAVSEVPAGRLVSLAGEHLSPFKEHLLVSFDGRPAPVSAISSPRLMSTVVPFAGAAVGTPVEVQVKVRGVPSNHLALRILPPQRSPEAPFILAKRVLGKQRRWLQAIRQVEWEGRQAEGPGPMVAAVGELRRCAADLEEELKDFETQLNFDARFLEVYEAVLHVSPEVEGLLDDSLRRLTASSAR